MYKKIDVYVNGVYQFSTKAYKNCKELKARIRADKKIFIASIPNQVIEVCDYDKLVVRYAKED